MPTPTTLVVYMTRNDFIDVQVYLTVPFSIYGYLWAGGFGIPGKTITLMYNGTSLGSVVTDANGMYQLNDQTLYPPDAPGAYILTANFAGDGTYDPSSGTFNFNISKMPSKIDIAIPSDFPEDQHIIFHGYLLNNVPDYQYQGYGISGQTVYFQVDGITKDSAVTDSAGKFTIPWLFTTVDEYSIKLMYLESQLYLASHAGSASGKELKIWGFKYPQPEEAETDCYGWVLCIDPNAIRGGPIYYLLDLASVKPGLTNKNGSFYGQLNDMKRDNEGISQYDYYLFGPGKPFILDQDEYWIGLQRGAVNKRYDPQNDAWNPTGGSDGKGSGRKWIMGGYISKRYYSRDRNKKVIAHIMGKDYMDVWKDQLFGTDTIPRNYEIPTGLDVIVTDILNDVNAQQEEEYKFTPHPIYFDGVATTGLRINTSYGATILEVIDESQFNIGDIVKISDADNPTGELLQITGVVSSPPQLSMQAYNNPLNPEYPLDPGNPGLQYIYGYDKTTASVSEFAGTGAVLWQREFLEDKPFDIIQEACEEQIYEWRINYLKQVLFYPKNDPPQPADQYIRYTTNIREIPEIIMGDTDDIITTAIIKDGLPSTRPDPISAWEIGGLWNEISDYGVKMFDPIFTPYPPNAYKHAYADSTLTIDDEGYPALNFQYHKPYDMEGPGQKDFQIHLFWPTETDSPVSGVRLDLDLRIYRKIKFHWRHATRDPATTNIYKIEIHSANRITGVLDLNNYFSFEFGIGGQEDLGYSKMDTVDSREWHEINLLLPEPDIDGNLNLSDIEQMKGWGYTGVPDPLHIHWVAFWVKLDEADPGYAVSSGKVIQANATPGSFYLRLPAPENLVGYDTGKISTRGLSRPIRCLLVGDPTTKREDVWVSMIYPPDTTDNVLLTRPLLNTYQANIARLYVLAGKSWSFSQLHFEKNYQETEMVSYTLGPRRYRIYDLEKLEYQSQADSRVEEAINMDAQARKWVKVIIDGDPEKEIGCRVRIYLDPDHGLIFQNLPMIIDNVDYSLETVDLEQTLTLTPTTTSIKPREISDFNNLDRTNLNLSRIARRNRKLWMR